MTTTKEKRVFKNLEEIIHPKYGKGKCVGYVAGGSEVRVQFESGEIRDFIPKYLDMVIKPK